MREPKLVEVMAIPPASGHWQGCSERHVEFGSTLKAACKVWVQGWGWLSSSGMHAPPPHRLRLVRCVPWHSLPAQLRPRPDAPAASATQSSQAVPVDISPAATGRKGLLTESMSTS